MAAIMTMRSYETKLKELNNGLLTNKSSNNRSQDRANDQLCDQVGHHPNGHISEHLNCHSSDHDGHDDPEQQSFRKALPSKPVIKKDRSIDNVDECNNEKDGRHRKNSDLGKNDLIDHYSNSDHFDSSLQNEKDSKYEQASRFGDARRKSSAAKDEVIPSISVDARAMSAVSNADFTNGAADVVLDGADGDGTESSNGDSNCNSACSSRKNSSGKVKKKNAPYLSILSRTNSIESLLR